MYVQKERERAFGRIISEVHSKEELILERPTLVTSQKQQSYFHVILFIEFIMIDRVKNHYPPNKSGVI